MSNAFLVTYFKNLEDAQKEARKRKVGWKRNFRILADSKGFYLVSEESLKKAGLIPRRKVGITLK